jgi:hypothetical protein
MTCRHWRPRPERMSLRSPGHEADSVDLLVFEWERKRVFHHTMRV